MVNKTEEPSVSSSTGGAGTTSGSATGETTAGEVSVVEVPQMRAVVLNSYGGLKGIQTATNRPQPQDIGENEILLKASMRLPCDSQERGSGGREEEEISKVNKQVGEALTSGYTYFAEYIGNIGRINYDDGSLNFQDLMTRLGVIDSPPKIPFVMGSDVVGMVTQVGKEVTRFKVADMVYALPETGAWAEYVQVDENVAWLVTKPKLDVKYLAASLPYVVANYLLQGINAGSSVVIHSAGGGVGLAVRDMAKLQGCKVLGICSGYKMEKIGGFESLIDRTFDYVAEIKKLHPTGVHLVLDPQGGEDCTRGLTLLSPGGKYILYGSANIVTGETKSFFSMAKSWWQVEKVSPLKLFEENKFIGGFHLRNLMKSKYEEVGKVLDKIWTLMETGQIKPTIDNVVSFEEVPDAMQSMHDRKNIGKLLIDPAARKAEKNDVAKENNENNAN